MYVFSFYSGTILLDTINLSATAQRATRKDIKIIAELEECLLKVTGKTPSRDQVYSPIVQARSDISNLSTEQLLRKDCKLLKTPEITVAIPAVPLLSQVCILKSLKRTHFQIVLFYTCVLMFW